MGLSGRKVKQRIGNDPRNLSWADDASRFGQSYLEKFGWDTSKGLGASGEGRTNAVKMSQKLDMLGIGMQRHQNDPDGIAWRQNQDFESLLQRLNEGTEAIGPFHKARESSPSGEGQEVVAAEAVDSAHDADEDADADATKRGTKKKREKKRRVLQEAEEEAARDKRERKKRKKSKSDVPEDDASHSREAQAAAAPASEFTPVPVAAPAPIRALPRAHRARIIAAKRMAASNSAALAEILGIPSSSSSTTATATATASPSPLTATTTPIPTLGTTSDDREEDSLQKLTTAAQSVGDYFRAKLGAKTAAQSRSTAPPVTQDADRDDDLPRTGLGAARLVQTGPSDEPVYAASKFAAMFARGQTSTVCAKEEEADGAGVERAETHDDEGGAGDEEDGRKSERRRAKEERRKKKAERRRRKEEGAKGRAIAEPDAEPPNDEPVVGPSMGEARPAKRKKYRGSEGLDGLLVDSPAPSDGRTVVPNKK